MCVAINTCILSLTQRTRLVAYAKGVSFEEINVHLKVKPDWFVEKINPLGKVPVIEHEGHIIRESLINFGELGCMCVLGNVTH